MLDEATSALDVKSELVVQAALQSLIAAERTTLVIAHRLSTVRSCDRVLVLGDGALLESGSPGELVADPESRFYALANAQLSDDDVDDDEPALVVADATLASAEVVVVNSPEVDVKKEDDDVETGSSPRQHVVGWLWGMTRGLKSALALGVTGAVIGGLTQPVLGYLLAEFLGVFFEQRRGKMRRESRFWAMMFLAMGGAALIGELIKAWGLGRITERVSATAKIRAFEATVRREMSFHDANGAGELASRLATDGAAVKALVGQRIAQSLSMIVIVLGGLAVSFEASWQLTLVTLGIIPLIVLPIAVTASYVQKVVEAAATSLDAASALASEAVLGVRTVKAFGMEAAIAAKFDECLAPPERAAAKKGLATGLGSGTAAMTILLGASFQYYVGSIFFRKGWVTFDELMTVLLVIIFTSFALSAVSGDAVDKAEVLGAATRLYRAATAPSAIDPFVGDDTSSKRSMAFEFKDVRFAYPTRPQLPVFDGTFSLAVRPGEVVALCGESGSGKSTVVQLLLRFYDVDAGAVLVDGVDVRSSGVKSLRRRFGVVSQEPALFAGTVADNVAYGKPGATRRDVEEACRLAHAADFVRALPETYDTQVGEQGIQLSGGQKQRVAIARAIVRQPDCLVFDEATSALDSTSEKVVQDALDNFLRSTNITTILIAHRLSTIKQADSIVVLDRGRVVERGPHSQLVQRRGAYFALLRHASSNHLSSVSLRVAPSTVDPPLP